MPVIDVIKNVTFQVIITNLTIFFNYSPTAYVYTNLMLNAFSMKYFHFKFIAHQYLYIYF